MCNNLPKPNCTLNLKNKSFKIIAVEDDLLTKDNEIKLPPSQNNTNFKFLSMKNLINLE